MATVKTHSNEWVEAMMKKDWKGCKPPLEVRERWWREAREWMEQANSQYREATTHFTVALLHAKRAGEALLKAKHRVPYKRWGDFVGANFEGSRETARVYMRIARHWDDPRINEARRGGMTPGSIEGFLDILRNKPPKVSKPLTAQQKATAIRQAIRKEFASRLKDLEYTLFNDGRTFRTPETVRRFSDETRRLHPR